RRLDLRVAVAAEVEAEVVGDEQQDVAARRLGGAGRGRRRQDGQGCGQRRQVRTHGASPGRRGRDEAAAQSTGRQAGCNEEMAGSKEGSAMLRFEGGREFRQAPADVYAKLADARFLVGCVPDVESVAHAEQSAATLTIRPGFAFIRGTLEVALQIAE